jgi:hypothetical protein
LEPLPHKCGSSKSQTANCCLLSLFLDTSHFLLDAHLVLKRIGHAVTVFALLTAIGAHWAVLQSVAWTTMLAENLRTSSVSEAVARTFDGEHPCSLCKQIAKGRQAEKKTEFRLECKKLEFFFTRVAFIFAAPSHFWEIRAPDTTANLLTLAPPVPPPRTILG